MEVSVVQIVMVFLVACLAGVGSVLEEFQTHRPLIACTLSGLVLGDLETGIIVGGMLEMVALGWMNIGAAMAPDTALASIISIVLIIVGKQDLSAGIALAIPVAAAGQILTVFIRTITIIFQHAADRAAKNENLAAISRLHLSAMILQALRVAIPSVIVVSTVGTDVVKNALNSIPDVITGGFKVAGGMVVVVGYAMVINMMRMPHLMMFFFVGFVIAALSSYNLVALGILGAAMAYFYIQLHPKYVKQNTLAGAQIQQDNNILDNQLD